MKALLRHWSLSLWGTLTFLLVSPLMGQTVLVFTTDDRGNVGQYDVNTGITTALGSLTASGFTPSQVIGLAFDSATNGVLILDRNAQKVYSMDATTGVTTVLFSTPGVTFQGGALLGGILYGINENLQQLAAYNLSGVAQSLSGTTLTGHVHGLGVNPVTGTLFDLNTSGEVRTINTDGTEGALLLSSSTSSEDVAYYNGNYLVANYDRTIYLLDGSTGVITTFLTDAQLTAMGVTGNVSGVALNYTAVPEPSTWAMLLFGGAMIGIWLRRRKTPVGSTLNRG